MTPPNLFYGPASVGAQDSASATHASPQRQARAARRRNWTTREDALVILHYPTGGADAVLAAGINRTRGAITYRAHILGVTRARPNAWTPQEDQALHEHYPTGGYRAVQAAGVNRSDDAIRQRAAIHGLPGPKTWGPWTPEEDQALRDHYPGGGVNAAQEAGVDRSSAAIRARAKRLGIRRATPSTNQPPPPPPPKPKARPARPKAQNRALTPTQAEHLHQLARLNGELLDADDAHHNTLRSLARKGLAKHIGAGLYKITLAGVLAAREHQGGTP